MTPEQDWARVFVPQDLAALGRIEANGIFQTDPGGIVVTTAQDQQDVEMGALVARTQTGCGTRCSAFSFADSANFSSFR
jgi:hypothetical protein